MTSRKFSSLAYNAKTSFIDILKSIKWQLIISIIVILVGFIIGIVTAFSSISTDITEGEGLLSFLTGDMASFSSFFYRLLSCLVVLFLLFLFSKSKWLSPFALVLIFYRAYLFGVNIGLLLRFYGISGVIVAIVIIFPLQLLLSLFFAIFYFSLLKKDCLPLSPFRFFLISIGIVLLINLILFLLLCLFSPNVILVL